MKQKTTIYFLTFLTILILSPNLQSNSEQKGDAWRIKVFNYIYKNKHWAPAEGIPLSGPGSTLKSTKTLRLLLPTIIKAVDAKTILDAGCGDFTWMQDTQLDVEKYIGTDIVEFVIKENIQKYENSKYSFYVKDITKDELPKVDIILCRDCLAHLSNEDIVLAIKNFKKSGAKYLLTTTYPKVRINNDIKTGNFRGINLQAYPFHFPVPVMLFEEISAERDMKKWGKWIALWRLEDIKV